MAELNFGLLTPPGSQSIGNAFAQGMDQAAVARAQENQNALAQYTLGKAKREDEQQNELYAAVRQPGFKFDIGTAVRFGAPGLAAYKAQQEADKINVDIAYTKAKTGVSQFDLAQKRTNKAIIDISNLPDSETALSSIDRHLAAGDIDEAKATALKAELGNPETFIAGRTKIIMGMLEAKDRLPYEKTTTRTTPLGNVSREQREDAFGRPIGSPTDTPIGVSANTKDTLAQAQQHFDGLSAYQKEQLRRQGKQFDSDRGGIVNLNTGTFEPVYLYPSSTPSASAAPAAPAATPTAPSAAPAGTSPLQLTPGMAPLSASQVPIPQTIVGARVPQAVQNVMNNDQLTILLKERDNQVFLGRVDPALDREIANLQGRPTSVASQTATQPAQRTVLGPKPEKPDASYYKEAKGIINTNNALNNLKRGISNLTPADMVNPSRRSEITQLSKTVALLSKEMFGLGVLNAGDLTILEQVIPNPVAFNQGLVPIETIKKNLTRASNTINQINNTLSRVHKQPLLSLDAETPNAPSPSAPPPPIQSFRRQ